jgi:hypothetical protein
VATSAWTDPDYRVRIEGDAVEISGHLHRVVHKTFTPWKLLLFRLFMLAFGWHTGAAYRIKGWIRKLLMLRSSTVPVEFRRSIEFGPDECVVTDEIKLGSGVEVAKAKLGDEFAPRYVPQSRYFQLQELDVTGAYLTKQDLETLNGRRSLRILRRVSYTDGFVGYLSEDGD